MTTPTPVTGLATIKARRRPLEGWLTSQPPAPLPRSVVPLLGETTDHYIDRLARANHQDPGELLTYLCAPHRGSLKHVDPDRLAAAAGQHPDRIVRLHYSQPGDHWSTSRQRHLRPACRRCSARHGLRNPVPCKLPDHANICRHHQIWIGPGVRYHSEQLDVAPLPDLGRAQQRHRQLLGRHDPTTVAAARRRAENILRHRIGPGRHWTVEQQHRFQTLKPDAWPRVAPESPSFIRAVAIRGATVTTAIYPEVVHLTELILDRQIGPHWDWLPDRYLGQPSNG